MGYEIPGALGVRMAQETGEVYVYIGDGTFLLNPGEITTAVQEGLKLTVVISENHGFQSIRRLQMLRAGRAFGNEFRARNGGGRLEGDYLELDLTKVAEGLGAAAARATTPDELRAALETARGQARTSVVVCETEPHRYLPSGEVWWDVAPAEVSRDPAVQEIRTEYEREQPARQRYHY